MPDLKREYQLDYRKAKPNRFASKLKKGGKLIVLDPEIAEVFTDSKEVNAVLRALLRTMPKGTKSRERLD